MQKLLHLTCNSRIKEYILGCPHMVILIEKNVVQPKYQSCAIISQSNHVSPFISTYRKCINHFLLISYLWKSNATDTQEQIFFWQYLVGNHRTVGNYRSHHLVARPTSHLTSQNCQLRFRAQNCVNFVTQPLLFQKMFSYYSRH